MPITGHTVDPNVVIRQQHLCKLERAARMMDETRLTEAALLRRRANRLATLAHYQHQLEMAQTTA